MENLVDLVSQCGKMTAGESRTLPPRDSR